MKVTLVAAPLTARSGVYRSCIELVNEARAQGYEWSAEIGLRPGALEQEGLASPWAAEFPLPARGLGGIDALRARLAESPEFASSDVVIGLIPQADIAIAGMRGRRSDHIAYVRGLPWPERGEKPLAIRLLWRALALRAMRSASETWATTSVLARPLAPYLDPVIMPPGLAEVDTWTSRGEANDVDGLVWAGRFTAEKRPELFLRLAADTGLQASMYGEGPLRAALEASLPTNVELLGWAKPQEIWRGSATSIYLGTSSREAFGRSVVEAAMAGIPIVVTDQYGCADLLVRDPELRRLFVLDTHDYSGWLRAIEALKDPDLRARLVRHAKENAQALTIAGCVSRIVDRLDTLSGSQR